MKQIQSIIFNGYDATNHKRMSGCEIGGSKFFEYRGQEDEFRTKILRWCTLFETDNTKDREWTNEQLMEIQTNCKTDDAYRFYALNGFKFGFDGADILKSVIKFLPINQTFFLRIKILINQNNSGAFELRLADQNKEHAEWPVIDVDNNTPEWDEALFGTLDQQLRDHRAAEIIAWETRMQEEKNGFYMAQIFGEASLEFGFCNSEQLNLLDSSLKDKITAVVGSTRWTQAGQVTTCVLDVSEFRSETQSNPILTEVADLINNKEPNILLYGPPGTGKTYLCQQIRAAMKNQSELFLDEDGNFLQGMPNAKTWWVTFHQGVSYEDFVLGLRPKVQDNGMELIPRAGPLLEAMEFAKKGNGNNHSVVFVDEINRGDLSRIFGDFITYMDMDKRGIVKDNQITTSDHTLPLTFSSLNKAEASSTQSEPIMLNGKVEADGVELQDGGYIVPPNLTIIATMNSLDRSVAPMDSAMKRRFYQVNISPESDLITQILSEKNVDEEVITLSVELMNHLNKWLENQFNEDIQVGPSYFLKIRNFVGLRNAWARKILPLLLDLCRSTSRRDALKNIHDKPDDIFTNLFNEGNVPRWPENPLKPRQLFDSNFSEEQWYAYFSRICYNIISSQNNNKADRTPVLTRFSEKIKQSIYGLEPAAPVDPVDPVEPGDPVEPVEAVDPVEPVEAVDPVEPVEAVDPVEPVEAGDPVEPVVRRDD